MYKFFTAINSFYFSFVFCRLALNKFVVAKMDSNPTSISEFQGFHARHPLSRALRNSLRSSAGQGLPLEHYVLNIIRYVQRDALLLQFPAVSRRSSKRPSRWPSIRPSLNHSCSFFFNAVANMVGTSCSVLVSSTHWGTLSPKWAWSQMNVTIGRFLYCLIANSSRRLTHSRSPLSDTGCHGPQKVRTGRFAG